MRYDIERFMQDLNNRRTRYFNTAYKIDDEFDENDILAEKLWPKRNHHTAEEKLMRNFPYGTIAYNQYCENDVKLTKEMTNNMHKIRKTNDPRMNYNTGSIYVVVNGKAYVPEMMEVRNNGFREQMEFSFTVTTDPYYAVENTMLAIKDVIHNPPATIVFWGDGSKTVVKCQDGEEYDPEKGLTMAFFKRMHDNKGHYFEEIKKWNKKYEEKYPSDLNGVTIELNADN